MNKLSCFKTYDIRGKLGKELNEEIAYRIGRSFAQHLNAKRVIIGCDTRLSSPLLKHAVTKGLMDAGADALDIGTTGSEEVYYATFSQDVDGGIEITASHNPINYNGMKFVGRGATTISDDSSLSIQTLAENNVFSTPQEKGRYVALDILNSYVDHLLTYIDVSSLKPMKIVVNAGNGAAGHVIDKIEKIFANDKIPIEFVKILHEPDGHFPNGIPNPLLVENRALTSQSVKENNADLGIAWDGDFDRCFLFDESGKFIEGYYIVGLLAEAFLLKNPAEKIIHDPRLIWNTQNIVAQTSGETLECKAGHTFFKEFMRHENAIYGGEMSSHHYFRDFAYCDSGMIPWLLVAELMSHQNKPLSRLVNERVTLYPCSGELNYKVDNPQLSIESIKQHFASHPTLKETRYTDGLSMDFGDYRFNLRASNTEPLLRLNVEAYNNSKLVTIKVEEINALIS